MKDLEELFLRVHRKMNQARSILQMITTDKFKTLWEGSSELEKKRMVSIVLGNNKDEVDLWIKHHPSMEVGELSIRRLRERGKRLRIKNYCRLMKYELVREIEKVEREIPL